MCRSRIGLVRNQTVDQHINKLESLERLSPEVGPANGKQFLLHVPLFVLFDIYAERFSEQIHILPTRTLPSTQRPSLRRLTRELEGARNGPQNTVHQRTPGRRRDSHRKAARCPI